jgi:preprotein translocase subunit SecA
VRADTIRTGLPRSAHVERLAATGDWADRALRWTGDRLIPAAGRRRTLKDFLAAVETAGAALGELSDADLLAAAGALRAGLRREGFAGAATAQAFALARELAGRRLGERPYDVQVRGAAFLLRGRIVEMETGEGKTLTATLPAATVALAGYPVHVVTVNDYLARRDAETMGPLYAALGLSVGVVTGGMAHHERRAAYARDVTYCTNKQLVFDYLRDRIVLGHGAGRARLTLEALHDPRPRTGQLLQRGLVYAIVDEADSVLIDEARTPLIISDRAGAAEEERAYRHAHGLAAGFQRDEHFLIDTFDNRIRLTSAGERRLAEEAGVLGGVWASASRREDLVPGA